MFGWGEESAGNVTEAEDVLKASLTGLELRVAISEEAAVVERCRGRGRGRLLLEGEVGEAEGREEGRCWVGTVIAAL